MKQFKISCHAISQIMAGEIGLTDVQTLRIQELQLRKDGIGKALTANMEQELAQLIIKRDNPELPAGAKTYIKKWLKEKLFNRKQSWKNVVIDKGLMCEEDGMNLMAEIYGLEKVYKNDEFFENDFMQGTPDIIHGDIVRDIKSSWDLFTFPMFDDQLPNKDYWWQLQGYMLLSGMKKASLDYVLIDTPKALVDLDLKKLYYQSGGKAEDWNPEQYELLYPNYRFSDIPKEKRIKSFTFEYDASIEVKINERVELCRTYINSIVKG